MDFSEKTPFPKDPFFRTRCRACRTAVKFSRDGFSVEVAVEDAVQFLVEFCLFLFPRDMKPENAQDYSRQNVFAPFLARLFRSAPKGRQQMGETSFCKNLRFSAENLRFPAVFCANLRLPNPLTCRASRKQRKSAKICENVRSGSGFSLSLSPFWRTLTIRSCKYQTSGRFSLCGGLPLEKTPLQ